MPEADQSRLDAVRSRRESLYQALLGLEDALSTPIGYGARWRLRVAMAVDHASNRIAEHITETEAPKGFLAEVVWEEPRLCHRVDQLKQDHQLLARDVHRLKVALGEVADDEVAAQGSRLRNQALELLGLVAAHRQRGADLIYEAYHVDIGNSA